MNANVVTKLRESGAMAWLGLALFVACLVAYTIARGQVVSWDLRNYHWYDAWAWWVGRPQDLAAAQLQTYFNPLLHVPFWWLAAHVPARAAVASLALVQGANAVLAFVIARRLLASAPHRDWLALACAAVGALGSTQVLELGATMGDNLVSIGLLGAVALLLPAIRDSTSRPWSCVAAGALAGAMVGLKLACAPIALGVFAASFFAGTGLRNRAPLLFAIAAAGGLLLTGGAWFLELWRAFGNPLHPYYGALFGGEWLPPYPSGDMRYHVHGIGDALQRPWALMHDWRQTSDLKFRDLRLPALLLAALTWPLLRRRVATGERRMLDALLVAFVVTWVTWLAAFGYYRYLATWELLAPACIVAIASALAARRAAILALLALIALTTNAPEAPRVRFAPAFLEQAQSPLAHGAPALVLLAGDSPTAFLLPGLGAQHAYVRVSGNYAGWPLPRWRADDVIATRIDDNAAPLFVLYQEADTRRIEPALARFGVAFDAASCVDVASNWVVYGEPPTQLCRARRIEAARSALQHAPEP